MKPSEFLGQYENLLKYSVFVLAFAGAFTVQAQNSTPYPLGVYSNNPNGSDSAAEGVFEGIYNSFGQLMGTTPKYLNYL